MSAPAARWPAAVSASKDPYARRKSVATPTGAISTVGDGSAGIACLHGCVDRMITSAARPIAAATANAPTFFPTLLRRCRVCCRSSAPGSGLTFCVDMRNTSCTSGIPRSFLRSEGPATLCGEGPHGRRSDAQDAPRLLGGVPEQVHEQEGGPLTLRQSEQQVSDVGSHLRVLEQVPYHRHRGHLADRHRGTTPSHPEPVERHAEQVARGVLDLVPRVPSLPERQERVLHQLLRVLSVPADEIEGLEEAFVLLLEELVEAGPWL